MSYSIKIGGIDKSNYVVDIDNISIIRKNRTGEPVSDIIKIKIVKNYAGYITEGTEVEIFEGNVPIWWGYVTRLKDDLVYKTIDVAPLEFRLASYPLYSTALHNKIIDVANWGGAKTFSPSNVNTTSDRITITSHGFTSGDVVALKSTGTLPSPLQTNVQYSVSVIDANTIELMDPPVGAPGSGIVDLITQGSGTHSITNNLDLNKFCRYDNVYLPNVSIEWLLKSMFAVIGATLTVENPLYPFESRSLSLSNVALDYNMMKVIGLPYATSTPDETDKPQILNCLQLFQRLVQIFKMTFVTYGSLGSKNYALLRTASYSKFDFNNLLVEDYETEDIFNDADSVYGVEMLASTIGGTCRNYYNSTTKTALVEGASISSSNPQNLYPFPSNLKILVRYASGSGHPTYHIEFDTSPIPTEKYIPITSCIDGYYQAIENDVQYESITAKAVNYLTMINKAPVVYCDINLKNRQVEIYQ